MAEQAEEGTPLNESIFRHSSGEHEQAIEILGNIRGNGGGLYSANLPNRGQVDNIPEGAVLESPATASAEGLRAIRPFAVDCRPRRRLSATVWMWWIP